MGFRFWIGMWITIILILLVAFDLSALVRYITRFTEESFAVLISLIFIYDAFEKQAMIYDTHPIHTHTTDELQSFTCHCEAPPFTNVSDTDDYSTTSESSLNSSSATNNSSAPLYTPIFDLYNWTTLIIENCITYKDRIEVKADCITEQECLDQRWKLVGPACYAERVTQSVPDVFFLSCFLFIGTFVIAIFFRHFRNSSFFPSIVSK